MGVGAAATSQTETSPLMLPSAAAKKVPTLKKVAIVLGNPLDSL